MQLLELRGPGHRHAQIADLVEFLVQREHFLEQRRRPRPVRRKPCPVGPVQRQRVDLDRMRKRQRRVAAAPGVPEAFDLDEAGDEVWYSKARSTA